MVKKVIIKNTEYYFTDLATVYIADFASLLGEGLVLKFVRLNKDNSIAEYKFVLYEEPYEHFPKDLQKYMDSSKVLREVEFILDGEDSLMVIGGLNNKANILVDDVFDDIEYISGLVESNGVEYLIDSNNPIYN